MTETPPQEIDASIETDDEPPTDRPDREPTATGPTETEPTSDFGSDSGPGSAAIRRHLTWGALGVCSLLAVFALIQFYGSVTDAIDLWIDPKYQPVMRAAFNLAVLLASLIGVSLLVRELN